MADDRPIRGSPGGAYAFESVNEDELSVANGRLKATPPRSPGSSSADERPIRPAPSLAADERQIQGASKGTAARGTENRRQHLDHDDDHHYHSDEDGGKRGHHYLDPPQTQSSPTPNSNRTVADLTEGGDAFATEGSHGEEDTRPVANVSKVGLDRCSLLLSAP